MMSGDRIPSGPLEGEPPCPPVRVRYNPQLRRRASARFQGGAILVELPPSLSQDRAGALTTRLVTGLLERRGTLTVGDDELAQRARALADRYLYGVRARSVRWSSRQQQRWASCSLPEGDIRVSRRLRPVPGWVLDAVLVHELVHLQVPGHGPDFTAMAARYPRQGQAGAFLEGFALGMSWPAAAGDGLSGNQCE